MSATPPGPLELVTVSTTKRLLITVVIAVAVAVAVGSACSRSERTEAPAPPESAAAPATTAPPETTAKRSGTQAFCETVEENFDLLKETDPKSSGAEIDQFVAVVGELADLAPDEVVDEARALADALEPVGDAPDDAKAELLRDVFDDDEVADAAERFADYVDESCGLSLSGGTTSTTTTPTGTTRRLAGSSGSEGDEKLFSIDGMKKWLADNYASEPWYGAVSSWGTGRSGDQWDLSAGLEGSATVDDALALCDALADYASQRAPDVEVTIEISGPDGVLARLDGLDSSCEAA